MSYSLAGHIRSVAQQIDATLVSTTKWNPIGDLVAESLGIPAEDVYVATVSKPGNLKVRLEQSERARSAPVVVSIYTGNNSQLENSLQSAEKRCQENPRTILMFANTGTAMTLVAIVKPLGTPVPSVLSTEYPHAIVRDC